MSAQFTFTPQLARLYSGLFVTFGLICLGLPYVGLVIKNFYLPTGGLIVAATFCTIIPLLSFAVLKYKSLMNVYLAVLNVAGFFAFLFFIGAYTPFVLLWVILLLMSRLYGGRILYLVSAMLLVIETTLILYSFATTQVAPAEYILFVILSSVVTAATIAFGYLMSIMIIRAQERTHRLAESQKAEEVQLNRLNTLLNSISDTVLTLNRYGRITSQNSAALSFFDTNQSLIGKSIDTILHVQDESLKDVSVRKLVQDLHGTLIRDDISMKDTSESVMRLSMQLSPIRGKFGDDDNGCVLIIRDITRQKTLEDEKDEFISVTSHELRTPIAIAEGSLSNLAFMFEKGAQPDKLKASADMAHEQVMYLGRMINDLSTLSRAERGVGDAVEEIDVNAMTRELYLRYQPEATAKDLKLDLDLDKLPNVKTSRLYLEEILQNFITNAIKYTKQGSVTLIGKMKDGKVTFSVKDTGIGISKTDQEKIFDKFFRSEDYRTRETNGTGLGLYVVRKLASKLNTKVEVESRLNHGSTFSFSLPANTIIAQSSKDDTKAS